MANTILTKRERDLLLMMARGLSEKECARAFDVSPYTVRTHVQHMKIKLHAKNKFHALVIALQLGEIAVGDVNPPE